MRTRAILPLLGVGLLVACSGASNTDFFNGNAAPSGTAAPASTTTDSTDPGDVTPSVDAGSVVPRTDSGSTTPTKDAAVTVDTGTPRSIYCGGRSSGTPTFCNGAQTCCGTRDQDGLLTYACLAQGSTCGGIPIECSDKADCPGAQVCCATFDNSTGYKSVSCSATCSGGTGGVQFLRLCDPDAPVDECADINRHCSPSQGLPGYGRCIQ